MNAQTQRKTKQLVLTALFMAMTCIATMVIQIPSPASGYVNMGDGVVLLGAWLLGPFYGMLAGGMGSMMADILSGYTIYAPGTLVIKALMALLAGLLFESARWISKEKLNFLLRLLSGIAAEAVMVFGYWCYAGILLGQGAGAALQSIPGNLVQAFFGILAAILIYEGLERVGGMNRIHSLFHNNRKGDGTNGI